jgi:hypothetical protein
LLFAIVNDNTRDSSAEPKSIQAAKLDQKTVNNASTVSSNAQQVQAKAAIVRSAKPATSKLLGSTVRDK